MSQSELVVFNDPKSPISESFRTLRTNIQFMNMNKELKCLLVTSSFPGEGKSWVSSNLAITFAQLGQKVLLIDADLRKGRLYKVFETPQKPGLSNYLSKMSANEAGKKENFNEIVKKTVEPNLYFIPSGTFPPNPSELLISSQMKALVEGLEEFFDIVIIDGTPCQLVTDARILSRIADSTVVVAEYNKTKKEVLKKTVKSIKNIGGNIAGVVINKIPHSSKSYYGNGYYYDSINSNEKKNYHIEETEKDIIEKKNEKIMSEIEKKESQNIEERDDGSLENGTEYDNKAKTKEEENKEQKSNDDEKRREILDKINGYLNSKD